MVFKIFSVLFKHFQDKFTVDAEELEGLRRQKDEHSAKLKEAEDKHKRMKVANDRLRVASRKKSSIRDIANLAGEGSVAVASGEYSSHYTSVGGVKEESTI